jgi:hypothetical protein
MTEPTEVDHHRSYSQLNCYRRCGEQFRLERIEHAPQRPGAAAVAGTVVHTATEWLDRQDALTVENHVAAQEIARDELAAQLAYWGARGYESDRYKVYGRQSVEWYRTTGIPQSIEAYFNWRRDNQDFKLLTFTGRGQAIEVPFNIQLASGLTIHGHVDRVFQWEDQYFPMDIKSGRLPQTDEQLGLYGLALSTEPYNLSCRWGFYIYNLKAGEAKLSAPLNLSHWTWAKLSKVYEDLDRALQAEIYIPHPGEECFHCSVSDSCIFAQAVV